MNIDRHAKKEWERTFCCNESKRQSCHPVIETMLKPFGNAIASVVYSFGVSNQRKVVDSNVFQLNGEKYSLGLGMLRFSKKYLPIVSVQKMYRSLVEPYFRYCCPVWGVSGINTINRLQKLQNRATRNVANRTYDASALPIIRELGWPTTTEAYRIKTLKMGYKSVNDQAPIYLTEMFVRLSDSWKRELYNSKTDFAVPRRKSAFGQKCFSHKGAKLWNDLSVEVKSSKSFEIFK